MTVSVKDINCWFIICLLAILGMLATTIVAIADVTIDTAQDYTSNQSWSDNVSIEGVTVSFTGAATAGDFNKNLNIKGGTLNVSSTTNISIGENFQIIFDLSGNSTFINMEAGSIISVTGNLNIFNQGTFNFQSLTVGTGLNNNSEFTRGIINFNDNVLINGEASFGLGAEAHLAAGKTFTATKYAEVQDTNGQSASFTMAAGSTFNAGVANHGVLWVGSDRNPSTAPAYFRILSGNNATTSPATINVGIGLEIGGLGQLIVEDNSTLVIDIADNGLPYGQGFLHIGGYTTGDLPDLLKPSSENPFSADWTGGTLKIGAQSIVNVNQRVYLGEGGMIDMSSQGKLNVTGDFYFKRDSIYKVGVSNGNISLISVSGTATIENGAIVDLPANMYDQLNTPFFTANSYANSNIPHNILYQIGRSGNNLVVTGDQTPSSIVNDVVTIVQSGGHGTSINAISAGSLIARTLLSSNTSIALKNRLSSYVNQALVDASNGNIQASLALKQMIGEELLNASNVITDTISQINSVLGNRFAILHTNFVNPPSAGNQDYLNRIWVSGFGSWVRQKNQDDLYGYHYNFGGIVLGYDRELENLPGLTLGLNAAWSSGELKINDGLSNIDVQTLSLGIYSSYKFKNGLFLDAAISFGFTDNDFDSNQVYGGHKTANFKSNSFQASLDFGRVFSLSDNIFFQPSVGLNYVHIRQKAWSERITSDPNDLVIANWFDNSSFDYQEIPINLKIYGNFETSGGVIFTPALRVGGIFMAHKPNREMRFGFVGSGDSGIIRGIDSGNHRFIAGADLKIQISDKFDLVTSYDLETRKSYTSHSGQIGLGISF
jgi:outer membrane autotransporter protein